MRQLRDIVLWTESIFPECDHKSWHEGDLRADAWKTYRGWRWEVRNASGLLIAADRSRDWPSAQFFAERVMRRHAEAGAA